MEGTTDGSLRKIELALNGERVTRLIDPTVTLQTLLRDTFHLYGVKCGCEDSNCGACSVLVDGKLIKSCCMLAVQADGSEVTTIEGLGNADGLHPLQRAFLDHFAVQCGFCTPGMILAAKALLDQTPHPTEPEIREALHGNICRCTGYKKILEAVLAVANGEYGPF